MDNKTLRLIIGVLAAILAVLLIVCIVLQSGNTQPENGQGTAPHRQENIADDHKQTGPAGKPVEDADMPESTDGDRDETQKPTEKPTEKPIEGPAQVSADDPTKPTQGSQSPNQGDGVSTPDISIGGETEVTKPTEGPTEKPTEAPTERPTEKPTEEPTEAPTEESGKAPVETTPGGAIVLPPMIFP